MTGGRSRHPPWRNESIYAEMNAKRPSQVVSKSQRLDTTQMASGCSMDRRVGSITWRVPFGNKEEWSSHTHSNTERARNTPPGARHGGPHVV